MPHGEDGIFHLGLLDSIGPTGHVEIGWVIYVWVLGLAMLTAGELIRVET